MKVILRFWMYAGIWAIALYVLLVGVTVVMGQPFGDVVTNLPVWGGLALVLAAFPAGVTVSGDVLGSVHEVDKVGDGWWRPPLLLTVGAAGIAAVFFVMAGYLGPAVARSMAGEAGALAIVEPTHLSLGELRQALIAATDEAERSGASTIENWLPANRLAWHYFTRTDSSVLPIFFALIGVLVGFWSRLTPRRQLQQAQQWAMGLFLLVTTYFAGENGYEMVILRAAGPAAFAADFRLLIPPTLVMALGWPTLLVLWTRHRIGTRA